MTFWNRASRRRFALAAPFALALLPLAAHAQSPKAPLTVDDLVRMKRISSPQGSPDGHYVVYAVRETDMEANKGTTDLWLLDLTAKTPAEPRRLTQNPANDSSPKWSPDSRTIYFLSTRSG